jgi:hypothetical protein
MFVMVMRGCTAAAGAPRTRGREKRKAVSAHSSVPTAGVFRACFCANYGMRRMGTRLATAVSSPRSRLEGTIQALLIMASVRVSTRSGHRRSRYRECK